MTKTSKLSAMSAKKRGARTTERKSAKRPQVKRVPATVLTGFRKDGKELIRAKDDAGLTRYRLSASA